MPESLEDFMLTRPPTQDRPLLGQTILLIEDSRFAAEAIRLLCLRSGARIRRADTLRSAARHLCTYRPSVLIVDLGLPDGSGLDLVAEMAAASPRVPVILATSGDDTLEQAALDAGADGFFVKPMLKNAEFQHAILSRLPEGEGPEGPRMMPTDEVVPDRIAYRDDLAHVAEMLSDNDSTRYIGYVAGFLKGLAKTAGDNDLLSAAMDLAEAHDKGSAITTELARIAGLVEDRLLKEATV